MIKKIFLLLWVSVVFPFETDFDYVVVGTNPISMFEAIYRKACGNRVLVVEQASECGGAWKSITVCGIPHVDLGCHEFGNDGSVSQFLQEYAGCKIVANAPPNQSKPSLGFYPSRGCYELTHNLERLMEHWGVMLALNTKLESVFIDSAREIAEVNVNGQRINTRKIVVTNCSYIYLENAQQVQPTTTKFPHLYLLIEDPTPSRFTYMGLSLSGCSRAMNLTQFVGLEGTGRQLIAIQVYHSQYLNDGQKCLDELKRMSLVDASARLLLTDQYTYEQSYLNQSLIKQVKPSTIFEILNTSHIANIRMYIDRWKTSLRPWNETILPPIES